MTNKLFVGSLSWDTTDATLRTAFEAYGALEEAKVVEDRETGRSRGFGFVTFADAQAATTAQRELDGSQLDGRSIVVNVARDRGDSPRRGGGGGGGGRGGRY